jgi:hypothetical protein
MSGPNTFRSAQPAMPRYGNLNTVSIVLSSAQ